MQPEPWIEGVRYSFTVAGSLSERALAGFAKLQVSDVPGAYTKLAPSPTQLNCEGYWRDSMCLESFSSR